jgi:hypothetical protein
MTIPTRSIGSSERFDLDALLHPADAFAHPLDVVRDPNLSRDEKRAILASWASDACAVEAAPELRQTPTGHTIRFDDIMDALRLLDQDAAAAPCERAPQPRRAFLAQFSGIFGRARRANSGEGQTAAQS